MGLERDLDDPRPELTVEVDREKQLSIGLNTTDGGWGVRGAIQGIEAAEVTRTGNDEFDIIAGGGGYRNDLDALADLTVVTGGGAQSPSSRGHLAVAAGGRLHPSEGHGPGGTVSSDSGPG